MKNLTLKVALVAVATFAGLNGFGQNTGQWATTPTVGKYTQSAAAPITAVGSVVYTDYITVGKTLPFFAWPSAAYNPTWNPAGPVPVTFYADVNFPTQGELQTGVQSTFDWKIGSGVDAAAAQTALGLATPIAAFTKNYVEIAAGTVGNVTLISAEEKAPGVTCAGIPVYFGFTTIASPTVTVTNLTSTKFGLDQVIVSDCDGNAALTNVSVTATLAPAQESVWHLNMPYKVYTVTALDGSGNIVLGSATDYTASSTVNVFGIDGATVPSKTNPKIVAASPIVGPQTYIVQDNKITVYEFDVVSSTGTISRKSDYLDRKTKVAPYLGNYGFNYYASGAANTKYYIIAVPKPVTGPIYHISNTFAY